MNILIDNKSGVPIYDQIYSQIKSQIISGALKEDEMLPSIRGLAKDLRISFITTKRAYEELEEQGLIYSVPGRGFFVCSRKLEMLKEKKIQDIEKHMGELIKECKSAELSKQNMMDMLDLLYDEEQ
mgnify:CR=1 FL=1